MLSERALVLNRNWVPIATIAVRQALIMLCRESAQVICPETYEILDFGRWIERSKQGPRSERVVKTPRFDLHMPEVILLSNFSGIPRRQISFTRKNLYRRDNYTCQYCNERKQTSKLTIDHVMPRSRGGGSSWENCVLACISCNTRKANRTPREAGWRLLTTPRRPNWNPLHEMTDGRVPEAWTKFLGEVKTASAVKA